MKYASAFFPLHLGNLYLLFISWESVLVVYGWLWQIILSLVSNLLSSCSATPTFFFLSLYRFLLKHDLLPTFFFLSLYRFLLKHDLLSVLQYLMVSLLCLVQPDIFGSGTCTVKVIFVCVIVKVMITVTELLWCWSTHDCPSAFKKVWT
jgi:hypothetical protein